MVALQDGGGIRADSWAQDRGTEVFIVFFGALAPGRGPETMAGNRELRSIIGDVAINMVAAGHSVR
jgi:hypothetical protein